MFAERDKLAVFFSWIIFLFGTGDYEFVSNFSVDHVYGVVFPTFLCKSQIKEKKFMQSYNRFQ